MKRTNRIKIIDDTREKWGPRKWGHRLLKRELAVSTSQKMKGEEIYPDCPSDKVLRQARRDQRPNCYEIKQVSLISKQDTEETKDAKKEIKAAKSIKKNMKGMGASTESVEEFLKDRRAHLALIAAKKVKPTWW